MIFILLEIILQKSQSTGFTDLGNQTTLLELKGILHKMRGQHYQVSFIEIY